MAIRRVFDLRDFEGVSEQMGAPEPKQGTTSGAPSIVPRSTAAYDAFAMSLGIEPTPSDDDLVIMLADVLGASAAGVSTSIVPGDMLSIVDVLAAFAVNAAELPPSQEASSLTARLDALLGLYVPQVSTTRPLSLERMLVLSLAMSQIGFVVASQPSPSNSKERYGWERLEEIFYTSFGDYSYGYDNVRYLSYQLMAWCGIFDLWAYKIAQVPDLGTWKIRYGIGSVSGMVSVPKSDVKPGDVGVIQQNQHHFLVAAVDGQGNITSVDGNTTATINGVLRSGTIWQQTSHTISGTLGFFRPKFLV